MTGRRGDRTWIRGCGLLLAGTLGMAVGACDTLESVSPAIAGAAGCPSTASVSAVASGDWEGAFGLDAATTGKIKAGVQAALELKTFAARLDGKVKAACGKLATDLGAAGSHADGPAACRAAMQGMADVKGQMGANAKLALDVQPPRCSASMDAAAECVAECDATIEPGKADIQCEGGEIVGRCDAQCTGSCHLDAAAKCEGTCQGSCSGSFSGKCGGECSGKCDGKKATGAHCAGTCEGSCTANAQGSCGGQCKGTCKMKAAAQCNGECSGSCSVDMQAPRCTGDVKPPRASAECDARCDASVQADVQCQPARVAIVVDGAANADAAAKYRAAIESSLPAVLEVAVGMKDQALGVAGNVKTVVEGLQATVSAAGSSSSAGGAKLAACVAAPFKAAFDAAASVEANVNVSVEVQGSASASASASGSASGKAGG